MESLVKTTLQTAVLAGFCLGLITTPLFGEEKNMSLSVDPMSLLGGAVPVTFAAKLADRFSLGLTGYDKFFSLSKVTVQGVGGGLSGKFHLSADAFHDGWFIKPEVMAGFWTIGDPPEQSRGYGFEPRLVAGYDWVWNAGFVLSLGIGIKYVYYSGDPARVKDISGFGFHELFPNADLSLGWAF